MCFITNMNVYKRNVIDYEQFQTSVFNMQQGWVQAFIIGETFISIGKVLRRKHN